MGTTDNQPISLATVLGGEHVKVSFRNGSLETVWVYGPAIRTAQRWMELDASGFNGEVLKVEEVYCRKPEGWTDGLTPESYEAVLAKGEELSRPFYDRARQRAAEAEGLWAGVFRDKQRLAHEMGLSLSAMPSPPSAPPTGSHPDKPSN